MGETRRVRVSGASGDQEAELTFGPVAHNCRLELILADGRRLVADASDYFEALLAVRRELEHSGLVVCCQGARRDVWPSGMARDMGAGLKAYVLTIGRRPSQEDLVEIFDPATRSMVGTVAEQEAQFREWWEAAVRGSSRGHA